MKNNILIILISIILCLSLISCADFTPQGNINMQNKYNITNVTYVNSTLYYGNGSQLTGVTVSTSNSSTYWDGYNDTNSTQFENSNGQLHIISSWLTTFVNNLLIWTSISGRPTVLSNFTNDLGFYNSSTLQNNSQLTNDNNYWNSTYAGFNKTYGDTLYSSISEPLWSNNQSNYYTKSEILAFGYYNSTDFVITDYFTKSEINSFNYYNSSNFNITDYFTSSQILAFNYYNSSNFNISDYYTLAQIEGFNYYNSTDFVISDYYTKTQIDNFGFYNLSDFDITNYYTKTQINNFNYYNSSNFNISDYYTKIDVDTNISSANTSMKNYVDGTFITQANEGNLNVNSSDYWDELNTPNDISLNDLSGTVDGSQTFSIGGNTLNFRFTNPIGGMIFNWTGAASGHLFALTQTGVSVPPGSANHLLHIDSEDSDVLDLHIFHGGGSGEALRIEGGYANFTNSIYVNGINTSIWDYNQTTASVNILNGTGLIKDWNETGFITNQTQDLSGYYLNSNPSNYWNDTYATFNKTYADTLYADISVVTDNSSWNETFANTLYRSLNNNTFDGNLNLSDNDAIIKLKGYNSTLYQNLSNSAGGIEFNQTIPEAKSGIWWDAYDINTNINRPVAWIVAHYNSSINSNAHSHISIETLDNNSGSPSLNSKFEITYGANNTVSNSGSYASFYNLAYVLFSNMDIRLSNSASDIRGYNEVDIFPYSQYTQNIGLSITNTSTNLVLQALGTSTINFIDNLNLPSNNITANYFKGNLSGQNISQLTNDLIYIQELSNDTTPQLSGYLDTNGNDLGSTSDEIENIYVATNSRIYFGDGQETNIYFNGTNLILSG